MALCALETLVLLVAVARGEEINNSTTKKDLDNNPRGHVNQHVEEGEIAPDTLQSARI